MRRFLFASVSLISALLCIACTAAWIDGQYSWTTFGLERWTTEPPPNGRRDWLWYMANGRQFQLALGRQSYSTVGHSGPPRWQRTFHRKLNDFEPYASRIKNDGGRRLGIGYAFYDGGSGQQI